jgi:hypothetical protein
MDEVQVGVKLIPIDQRSVFYMVNYFAALVFGNITFRYTLQYSLTYFYFTTSMIKAIIKIVPDNLKVADRFVLQSFECESLHCF